MVMIYAIQLNETRTAPSLKQQKDESAAKSMITPLLDFNWKTTEPLQLRPFKPKYHLTMGEWRPQIMLV